MKTEGEIAAIRAKLGQRIHDLRVEQGLSQYRFSEMVSMDRTYLIGVEKGRRNVSVDNLIKISQGFGIPLSELFHDVEIGIEYDEGGYRRGGGR